jgi:hypothetical protein
VRTGEAPATFQRVNGPSDLNDVAHNQFAAPSGFYQTVDLNFATLNQHLRLATRIRNAAKF